MSVTMQDVARRAGVSIKTVSNVMNGYRYISPATKSKVEAAIEELGYRLNVTARNLRARRTGMIGLAVPELSLPYFGELADAVIRAADAVGYTVLIEQTGADRAREVKVLTGERYLTDGLLFSPLGLGQDDVALFDVELPMVVLGERVFDAAADHVTMNDVEAAYAATRHLLHIGRRRIAVLGAHPGEVAGSAGLRIQGYERALTEAGIAVDPALVGPAGLWHRSTGAKAMSAILDSGVEVDAVFALNDALALGALHALHVRRIEVPEQIAVVGFDDIDEARYSVPPLTTIDPGRDQIARTAVDLLIRRITEPDDARPFQRVVADFSLVGRESTGDVAPGEPERIVATVGGAVHDGPARGPVAAPAQGTATGPSAGGRRHRPLLDDGGTPVLAGDRPMVAPGGQSVSDGYLAFRIYGADSGGDLRLGIRELAWDDGRPVAVTDPAGG